MKETVVMDNMTHNQSIAAMREMLDIAKDEDTVILIISKAGGTSMLTNGVNELTNFIQKQLAWLCDRAEQLFGKAGVR